MLVNYNLKSAWKQEWFTVSQVQSGSEQLFLDTIQKDPSPEHQPAPYSQHHSEIGLLLLESGCSAALWGRQELPQISHMKVWGLQYRKVDKFLYKSLTPGASSMIFWCLLCTLQSLSNKYTALPWWSPNTCTSTCLFKNPMKSFYL